MKELILVRHAKSSWKLDDCPDFYRPLNERGYREAPVLGRRLAAECAAPDAILCSPAVRAYSTALFLRAAWMLPWDQLAIAPAVYEATAGNLLDWLAAGERPERLVVVGHNPGLSDLFAWLTSADAPELRTACAVALSLHPTTPLERGSARLTAGLDGHPTSP